MVWERGIGGVEGHSEVWCWRRGASITDTTIGVISVQTHNASHPRVVADPQHRATVAWVDDDPDPTVGTYDQQTRVRAHSGSLLNPDQTTDDVCLAGGVDLPQFAGESQVKFGSPPALAVDGMGNVTAVWTEHLGSSPVVSSVVSARMAAGTGTWSMTPVSTGSVQPDGVVALSIASADAGPSTPGDVSIGWLGTSGGIRQGKVTTRMGAGPDAGTWHTQALNASGIADDVAVAATPSGGAIAAVTVHPSSIDRLDVVERTAGSTVWSAPTTISAPGIHARTPSVVVDALGGVTAVWESGGGSVSLQSRHRPPESTTWDALAPLPASSGASYPRLGVDSSRQVTALWTAFGSVGSVHATTLTPGSTPPAAAPVARMTSPSVLFLKSRAIAATWTSTGGTAPVTYDVRYRAARPTSGFGAAVIWRSGTTATAGTLTGAPGTTCFSARATGGGKVGAWSAERCAVVPLDDRALSASAGWAKRAGVGYYAATYRQTAVKNAALRLPGVRARTIVLGVGTGPGYGRIRVSLGSTVLGTFSLASPKVRKGVALTVKTFAQVRTGKLSVVAVTAGKKVVVDSVSVRQ